MQSRKPRLAAPVPLRLALSGQTSFQRHRQFSATFIFLRLQRASEAVSNPRK
jgi:hypothetical protein